MFYLCVVAYDQAGNLNDLWKFSNGNWTWISGSSYTNSYGVYGTQGIASPSNFPGARTFAAVGFDSAGSFWVFGGSTSGVGKCFICVAYDQAKYLNDLWTFSNGTWTWISGSSSINSIGVYGTQGIASPSNFPGGRAGSAIGFDSAGSLWVFGGYGYVVGVPCKCFICCLRSSWKF